MRSAAVSASTQPVDAPDLIDPDRDAWDLGLKARCEPEAFWSALTPAQALALLRAAPKVAGAWTSLGKSAYRSDHAGRVIAAATPAPWCGAHSAQTTADGATATLATERVDTLDGAKAAADAALVAAGWVLVDDDSADSARKGEP